LSLVWWCLDDKQQAATLCASFPTLAPSGQLDCSRDLISQKPLHLIDFLTPSRVAVQQPLLDADAVLAKLVALALPSSIGREETLREVKAREAVFPTALGDGVALPHVRSRNVAVLTLSAVVLTHAIPFGSRDGNDVDMFLLVLSPSNAPSEHLQMLRAVAKLVARPATIAALRHATSVAAFLEIVRETS